jgi:hypothetical protein
VSISYIVVNVPEDRFGSTVADPPSNDAHTTGFAGDFVPNPLPVMVALLPWLNVPLTELISGEAAAVIGYEILGNNRTQNIGANFFMSIPR